jgi:hypothetical protein
MLNAKVHRAIPVFRKDRFGETPKPARETRALPDPFTRARKKMGSVIEYRESGIQDPESGTARKLLRSERLVG